jgi:hypothetical protein
MENSNQPPVDRDQTRADQVVAMARRHAEEIRAAAEQDAERRLVEAEREIMRRHEERLEADRRERVRIGVQRQHIEDCLDATAAAVTRMRELMAGLPVLDQADAEATNDRVLPAVARAEGESTNRRHRIMNGVAVILAGWAVVMFITLIVVSTRPAGDAKAKADVPTTQPVEAVPAPVEPVTPSLPVTAPVAKVAPVAKIAPVAKVARPVHVPAELGLTVAFVAERDCWISITRDDDAPSDRMLKASERYVVRAREAVSFKAGNAGALSMLINDRPAGPLGTEGQVVARRITRANYRSFLQS